MKHYRFATILLAFLIIGQFVYGQHVHTVKNVTITVSDLDASVAFYTETLAFEKIREYAYGADVSAKLFGIKSGSIRITEMRLGDEVLQLMAFAGNPGRPIPADSRSNDLWFQHIAIVVSDMDAAYRNVYDAGVVHVSTAPQTLPASIPAAAGITAFYFRDPDGHNLELIHFPPDKGNPKWQQYRPGQLFLGIDHTAIGIDRTERGLQFYTNVVDLKVGGHSENQGHEQERLNQVFGARLLITGLHADRGFGIEFLDYIAPPGGRPYPEDSTPADLWHWHTTLQTDQLEALQEKISEMGYVQVSQGIVEVEDSKIILVRDPDGHVLWIEEAPLLR